MKKKYETPMMEVVATTIESHLLDGSAEIGGTTGPSGFDAPVIKDAIFDDEMGYSENE